MPTSVMFAPERGHPVEEAGLRADDRSQYSRLRGSMGPVVGALMLAACSQGSTTDTEVLANAEAQQGVAAAEDGRILCARGNAPLARSCTVEQTQGEAGKDGTVLTLRHPDGAFRRFTVTTDGRGVIPADGAEDAKVSIIEPGVIEVNVAGDRYRLPATVKANP